MLTQPGSPRPIGSVGFCERNPQHCQPVPDARRTAWTPQLAQAVTRINQEVNAAYKPMLDSEIYGKEEYWAFPETAADCEDFALAKKVRLHQLGIPLSNLLLTVVTLEDGTGHAILTIRTTRGDLILDNLRPDIRLWTQTNYTYIKRQNRFRPENWDTILQANS